MLSATAQSGSTWRAMMLAIAPLFFPFFFPFRSMIRLKTVIGCGERCAYATLWEEVHGEPLHIVRGSALTRDDSAHDVRSSDASAGRKIDREPRFGTGSRRAREGTRIRMRKRAVLSTAASQSVMLSMQRKSCPRWKQTSDLSMRGRTLGSIVDIPYHK
jgi:hypothetical protein